MIDDREYGPSHPDVEYQASDETQFRLGDVVKAGDRIGYAYDFGDGWEHELAGPPSPERDEIREWAGDYDPARFDLTTANAAVAAV